MDRVDVAGMAGLALVAAGVWGLAGWPWAAVLVGCSFLSVYVLREVRAAFMR